MSCAEPPTRTQWLLRLALAASGWLAPSWARADAPLMARLDVPPASRGCIDATDLEARIEDVLERDALVDEAPITLRVETGAPVDGGPGLTLSVRVLAEDGSVRAARDVSHASHDCTAVRGVLSVVVAMLLDDHALDVTSAAAPVAPAATTLRVRIAVGAALSIGLLPGPAPGAELRGELGAPGSVGGSIALTAYPAGTATGTPGGEFWALLGSLGVCTPEWREGIAALEGCLALSGGVVRGAGSRVDRSLERLEPLVSIDGHAVLWLELAAPVSLGLRIGAHVPVVRPSFFVQVGEAAVTVHEPWPVIPSAALWVAVTSP